MSRFALALVFGLVLSGLRVAGPVMAQSSPQSSGGTPAHYVVLEIEPDGSLTTLYSTMTRLQGTLASLSAAEMAARLAHEMRDQKRLGVTLRDGAGQVAYRTTVDVPRWIRGEFLSDEPRSPGDSNIDGHAVVPDRHVFVLRVPALTGARLSLESRLLARPATLDLDALAIPAVPPPPPAGPPAQPLAGWTSGDPGNRVDLLVMGDGYTAAQQSLFEADALGTVNAFFGITPYSEYRRHVNVTMLFTESAQSGADQPAYSPSCTEYARVQTCCGDASASGEGSASVSTALGATFCSYDIQRLLTIDIASVLIAAAAVPDWDQILVLVNDATYGGSGGALATISMHTLAVDVARHEYGHSFTNLADEYSTAYPGYWACSDVNPQISACEANVTDETSRSLIKWEHWIDLSMSVPSVGPPPVATDGGLWEGARYLTSGIYRQGYDCLMRSLGTPFCNVASEAYVIRLYEGGWGTPSGGIDAIEPGSEDPAPGDAVIPRGRSFSATLLGPAALSPLDVSWYIDGGLVSQSTAFDGETVWYVFDQPPGDYTLDLEIIDRSSILHPTIQPGLAHGRTWNVTVDPAAAPIPGLTPEGTGLLAVAIALGLALAWGRRQTRSGIAAAS